ncbi:hypothetical protein Tco_0827291, partial [Tanacetum coccineum]
EVIENGNAPLTKNVVEGVETTISPSTAEKKAQRRLELKARSTLLMGIPNEHQLKFNSIKDAKSLLGQRDIKLKHKHTKHSADHQLAERLQAQEQEELSIEEKATLFQQILEKRRKHFAAKRAEEKRNKPPTKAQQRQIMCTYLKNIKGYKLKDLKFKEFDSIQEMFDKAFKRVNTFEDFRTELVEGKEKRAGTKLIQENTKKQKFRGDVGIKSLLDAVRITAAHVCVNAAQLELVLLRDFKENMLNCSAEVNAASENMLEVTTASEYQVNAAS